MTQQPWQQPAPQVYPPQYQPPTQYPAGAPQPQYGALADTGQPEAFNSVAPPVGGEAVKMHQLEGRLILLRPTSAIAPAAGYNGGPAKDQMTIECIVLDGPPIVGLVDGRSGQVTKPFAAGPKQPPFFAGLVYVNHELLLSQLSSLAVRPFGFALNRVGRGAASGGNSAPFKLELPSPADEALARSVVGNRIADGFDRIKAASAPEPEQPFTPAQQTYQQPQQSPYPAQQPQPYAQPTPQQYPAQGPPAAPWGQPPAQPQGPATW